LRKILTSELRVEPVCQEALYIWILDAFNRVSFFSTGFFTEDSRLEIAHRSYVSILNSYQRFDRKRSPSNWLLQVCMNTARNYLKSSFYKLTSTEDLDKVNVEDKVEEKEQPFDFVEESFLKLYHTARELHLGTGLREVEHSEPERFFAIIKKASELYRSEALNLKSKTKAFQSLCKLLSEISGDDSFYIDRLILFKRIKDKYRRR
jgi:hypothetical protein